MTFNIHKKWNYYNDFDEKTAAWAKELIRRGLAPDGEFDTRSILEVKPEDLNGYVQCHFFCGILGWPLALRLAGWADDRPVWTGSPPCQPFSMAGQQKGKDDERHLAPHFAALVAACRPPVLFGEQVASAAVFGKAAKRTGKAADGDATPEWAWLDDLCERLEAAHYACGASDIPAAGVGAAHIRQRTFFGAKRLDDPAGPRHDGPVAGAEGLARNETWLRLSGAGRDDDGLADADDARPQGRPGVSERADQLIAGAGGLEGGLEHGESDGRQQWRPEPSGRGAASGRGSVGLAENWKSYAEWFGVCWDDACPSGDCQCDRRTDAPAGYYWDVDEGWLADDTGAGLEARRREQSAERGPVKRPERLCDGVGLADADGRNACAEREQRSGQHGQQPQDGGVVGLADAKHAERWSVGQHGEDGRDGPDSGREEAHGLAGTRGEVCGRPDAADGIWGPVDWLFCRDAKWRPVASRPQQMADELPDGMGRGGDFSGFAGSDEEKAWAIAQDEIGFPLGKVHYVRVMRLRGYGNAIVPAAAAEFIKAFDAASDECFRLTDVSGMTTDNNHEGVFG